MKNFRFNALIVLAIAALTMSAAPKKKSILSLKESITDEAIVYPYSFEINTQEMQKNWYLQNYAVVDASVESKSPNEVSDAEYIQRLRAIPSGIELPYNQVVKSYITRYITRERTMVSQILGMSPYYMPIFERALEKRDFHTSSSSFLSSSRLSTLTWCRAQVPPVCGNLWSTPARVSDWK